MWTPTQENAIARIGDWLRGRSSTSQVFRLFGYAGTGKTTLARHLAAQENGLVLFAAYTGKAASVLRERGCEGASTLHQLMYTVHENDYLPVLKLQQELEATPHDHPSRHELEAELRIARVNAARPRFSRNPDSIIRQAKLLVLDEVSMVNEALARDVLAFGCKVLVLGDPAQLPPIEGAGYFTQAAPDIMLTEIHRQARDNPIIRWATMARNGQVIPKGKDGPVAKIGRSTVDNHWLAQDAGQIITGKNDSRRLINQRVRDALGHYSNLPVHGDTLVCLRNDHKLGTLNGVLCASHMDAVEVQPGIIGLNVKYEHRLLTDLLVDASPFDGNQSDHYNRRDIMRFDYGYAITVHKAQGSQWPCVTLWDDGFGKRDAAVRKSWLYTAITRAKTNLTILTSD